MSSNRIIVRSPEGVDEEVDEFEGLQVTFQGEGSVVVIHQGAVFANAKILSGAHSNMEFQKTHPRGLRNVTFDLRGGRESRVRVGENTSIESARFAMANENRCSISIGANCLISSNIEFRATDGHVMFDLEAPEGVINRTNPIVVGDHVWIGSGVAILKGARIPNDSVAATRAVITKSFTEPNVVLAGIPATVVKRNIGWSREYISRR